jgi:hypothetical protein
LSKHCIISLLFIFSSITNLLAAGSDQLSKEIWQERDSFARIARQMPHHDYMVGQLDDVLLMEQSLTMYNGTNNLCGPTSIANAVTTISNRYMLDRPATTTSVREVLSFAYRIEILEGTRGIDLKKILDRTLKATFDEEKFSWNTSLYETVAELFDAKIASLNGHELALMKFGYFNKNDNSWDGQHWVLVSKFGKKVTLYDPYYNEPVEQKGVLREFFRNDGGVELELDLSRDPNANKLGEDYTRIITSLIKINFTKK